MSIASVDVHPLAIEATGSASAGGHGGSLWIQVMTRGWRRILARLSETSTDTDRTAVAPPGLTH